MTNFNKIGFLFLLMAAFLFVVMPSFAQEATPKAVPVVDVGTVPEPISPDVLLVVAAVVFVALLGGTLLVLLKAIEALKISVPKDVVAISGNQIIELINQGRQYAKQESKKTATPIDDALLALADVPLDVIVKLIEQKTGSVPIELLTHLGMAKEVKME